MAGYTRIVAPFAGVITNRYADNGALIAAGTSSSTQAIPVVRLAETSKLRLVLPDRYRNRWPARFIWAIR